MKKKLLSSKLTQPVPKRRRLCARISTGSSDPATLNTASHEDATTHEPLEGWNNMRGAPCPRSVEEESNLHSKSPERKVLSAFLEQGIRDALGETESHRLDALHWILERGAYEGDSKDVEDPRLLSFRGVCRALDIGYIYTERIVVWAEERVNSRRSMPIVSSLVPLKFRIRD